MANRRSVEREKERTKNRTLRDTSSNVEGRRGGRLNNNMMSAIRKIRSKSGESKTRETIEGSKSIKQYLMVNCVKSRREIKKDKSSDLTTIRSKQQVVVDSKYGSLGRVKFAVGRLEWTQGRKSMKMSIHAKKNNALKNFRKKVKI